MAVSGAQQFWVVGARCYFRRKGTTNDSIVDLGTIKTITPQFDIQKITLKDSDGGKKSTVLERVTEFTEKYEFACANFNPHNLSLMFAANDAETYTQSAGWLTSTVTHNVKKGQLLKLRKSATEDAYNVSEAHPFPTASGVAIVSITGAVIKLTGDVVSTYNVPGKQILVAGNSSTANGVYTIVSAVLNTGNTDVTVSVAPPTPSGTGTAKLGWTPGTDYELFNGPRGLVRILSGGALVDATDYAFAIKLNAIASGTRLVNPQTAGGTVDGTMWIYFGRDGNTEQSVRECEVSLSTSGVNLTADDTSDFTLSATVLSDATDAVTPAGRLLQFVGSLPDAS